MNYKLIGLCLLIVFAVYVSVTSFSLQAESKVEGKAVFENKCAKCHPLSLSLKKKKNLKKWKATTLRMAKKKDSDINSDEAQIVAEYLSSVSIE